MKGEVPLTLEQRLFAADHHNLVYKFLGKKHLPKDEFYDVVIFGYLRAVYRYLTIPELQKYTFKTVAWKAMEGELCNYNRFQKAQKRNAIVFSLNTALYEDGLLLEETIAAPNPLMRQLEDRLLLHDLAKRLSKQQIDIVYLKSCGYDNRDIARRQNTSLPHVQQVLSNVHKLLLEICYGQ